MDWNELDRIYRRAFSHASDPIKTGVVIAVLLLCGMLLIFCRAVGRHAGVWMSSNLMVLGTIACLGPLLALGIVIIRMYYDESKEGRSNLVAVLHRSWMLVAGVCYSTLPLILVLIGFWVAQGVYLLLGNTPAIGPFFAALLAGIPFVLNVAVVVILLLSALLLIWGPPQLALSGSLGIRPWYAFLSRVKNDPMSHLIWTVAAAAPLLCTFAVLVAAAYLTHFLTGSGDVTFGAIRDLSILLPFASLLAPALIITYHIAADAHLLLSRTIRV